MKAAGLKNPSIAEYKEAVAEFQRTKPDVVRLVTLPMSNYCESSRWGLQVAEVPWREDAFRLHNFEDGKGYQYKHMRAASSTRAVWADGKLDEEFSKHFVGTFEDQPPNKLCWNQTAVPLAVSPEGTLLDDSFEIMAYAAEKSNGKLRPGTWKEDNAWKETIDLMGAAGRNLFYKSIQPTTCGHEISDEDNAANIWAKWFGCVGDAASLAQYDKGITSPSGFGTATFAMAAIFRLRDPIHPQIAAKTQETLDEGFAFVEKKLAGKPFLGGDTPSADDFLFAGTTSWLYLPPNWGANVITRWPDYSEFPPSIQAAVDKHRSTAAGQMVMRLYRDYRLKGLKPSAVHVENLDTKLYPTPADPGAYAELVPANPDEATQGVLSQMLGMSV